MKKNNVFLTLLVFLFVVTSFAAPQMGTMTDSRDGKTYKTVKIGLLTWMAENLNFKMSDAELCFDSKASACSQCYKRDGDYCGTYGQLYTWDAAMKACPTGWHLPSEGEFVALFSEVSERRPRSSMPTSGEDTKKEGDRLRYTSGGWERKGIDSVGFSARPAGQCLEGRCSGEGWLAVFWSSHSLFSGNQVQGFSHFRWLCSYRSMRKDRASL